MKTVTIKSKGFMESDLRLDAAYHLSEGPLSKKMLELSPYPLLSLSKVTNRIFSGNIFRRVYVAKPEFGYPYITASDMVKSSLETGKYISKKYTSQQDNLEIKAEWILVSCSGTLGNTVFTNNNFKGRIGTHDLIRIVPDETAITPGFLYAYLKSRYGKPLLTQASYGGVVKHIEPHHLYDLPIPIFPEERQIVIKKLISKTAELYVQANELLEANQRNLLIYTNLKSLNTNDFEFFGNQGSDRILSTFKRSVKDISSTSINAFNYSIRIFKLINEVKKKNQTKTIFAVLDHRKIFSTGSFPRIETKSPKAITLVNQSDIFNFPITGKRISRRNVKADNLVNYGEILVAGVGTLGENETFCKVIFANEELENELVSGEFLRMNTINDVPPGYLFTWLSSEYGFRFLRSIHTGTKLCRPIQKLLYELPVPIIAKDLMEEIHLNVVQAHTLRYKALLAEKEAVQIIEKEIESWQD